MDRAEMGEMGSDPNPLRPVPRAKLKPDRDI